MFQISILFEFSPLENVLASTLINIGVFFALYYSRTSLVSRLSLNTTAYIVELIIRILLRSDIFQFTLCCSMLM